MDRRRVNEVDVNVQNENCSFFRQLEEEFEPKGPCYKFFVLR